MQRKKIYNVSFYFDLHTVSCPGVWLCPKGKVAVTVTIFGVSEMTKRLPPAFPLSFHERFHFQKRYKKASNLHEVDKALQRAVVSLELFQYPQATNSSVKLAEFKARVGDIIYPPAGGLDLLFCTTETFPGIIAPKAEVSTQLTLSECGAKNDNCIPTTILSKGTKGRPNQEKKVRQRPVCHTKHYLYCSCFDQNMRPLVQGNALRKRKQSMLKSGNRNGNNKGKFPAHELSHRNHGNIPPFTTGNSEEGDFGMDSDRYPSSGISEVTSRSFGTEKNNIQPKHVSQDEDTEDRRNGEIRTNADRDKTCCLCCPRAPNLTSTDGRRNSANNKMSENDRKNGHSLQIHSNSEKEGKNGSWDLSCSCEHSKRLFQIIRPEPGRKKKSKDDSPLFFTNLCKAYERLLNECGRTSTARLKSAPNYLK